MIASPPPLSRLCPQETPRIGLLPPPLTPNVAFVLEKIPGVAGNQLLLAYFYREPLRSRFAGRVWPVPLDMNLQQPRWHSAALLPPFPGHHVAAGPGISPGISHYHFQVNFVIALLWYLKT